MEIREIIFNIMAELQDVPEEEIAQIHNIWIKEGIFKHPLTLEVINNIMH